MNIVLVERYAYDVFGRPTIRDPNGAVITESALANPYLFTGRAWDSETALYYYRARYYDYYTGRFLQPDPTGYANGLNLYSYCGNNPLNWADPYGLCKGGGWIDWLQGGIDVVGIFDPTGISDAFNALIYLGRGQRGNASISGLAIIPYIGDLGKAGKYGGKALKYSDEAADFAKWLNTGPADVSVYKGLNRAGRDVYAGLTNDMVRRQRQWGSKLKIIEWVGGLKRNQARAIEQVFIEQHPKYLNKINSVSPSNPNYQQVIDWAKSYLRNE